MLNWTNQLNILKFWIFIYYDNDNAHQRAQTKINNFLIVLYWKVLKPQRSKSLFYFKIFKIVIQLKEAAIL